MLAYLRESTLPPLSRLIFGGFGIACSFRLAFSAAFLASNLARLASFSSLVGSFFFGDFCFFPPP